MPAGGREIDPFRTLQPGLGLLKVPASCSMLEELQSIFKCIGIERNRRDPPGGNRDR